MIIHKSTALNPSTEVMQEIIKSKFTFPRGLTYLPLLEHLDKYSFLSHTHARAFLMLIISIIQELLRSLSKWVRFPNISVWAMHKSSMPQVKFIGLVKCSQYVSSFFNK